MMLRRLLHLVWMPVLLASPVVMAADAMTQTCLDGVSLLNPASSYTDNGNGTVTSTVTGLTWRQCPLGQTLSSSACSGDASYGNWETALSDAQALSFAGYSDWRLPNINELRSLVERACTTPAINASLFPLTYSATAFWSSTSSFSDAGQVRVLDFTTGAESLVGKSEYKVVYVVRGGN